MKTILLASAVAFGLAGGAYAQTQNQDGLVNVAVGDVAALNDIGVLQGTSVQVPIGIAAQVCGVDANVLAQQGQGAVADCEVNQDQATESFINFVKNHQTSQGGGGNTADQPGNSGSAPGQQKKS
jgi:hypothetical protein